MLFNIQLESTRLFYIGHELNVIADSSLRLYMHTQYGNRIAGMRTVCLVKLHQVEGNPSSDAGH